MTLSSSIQTCGFGSALCQVLVGIPQLRVKTRLAHSACFAAITLRKAMTTGRTIENCGARCVGIRNGNCFRSAPDALLTDD
jgi:hypothetical protein